MPFRPLPDLERNKFIDVDDENSIVKVTQFDSDGNDISKNGTIDDNNSSHETLLAGITFVGEPTKILDYSIIFVSVFSDVASATDGLLIEQGHTENGVETIHWDINDVYTIPVTKGKVFAIQPALEYIRVSYTNGVADQDEFRLHTVLKQNNALPTSHRLKDQHSLQDDASLQKSVILQEHPDGTVKNVSTMHPLSVDTGVVFSKDLDLSVSDNFGFSGSVTDYFDSLTSINSDSSATNPKQILLWFNNTVYASEIGFGCDDIAKSFSNQKIKFLGSGQSVRSIVDDSADNTTYNSRLIKFGPTAFNGLILEFHTANEICLSNITIRKEQKVVSQLQALRADGVTVDIGASDSGNLKTTDAEGGLAIAKGEVIGSSFVHKFGAAPLFDITSSPLGYVSIWDGSDSTLPNPSYNYIFSATADITQLSSSDNGDAQDIEIQGLDANWELVVQTITLTGQTPVDIDTPLMRVFRMKNVGSVDLDGVVYLSIVTATIVLGVPALASDSRAVINNGNNQTLMAVYSIPAGKTGYMRDWYASTAGAKKTSVHVIVLRARPFGQVFQLKHVSSIIANGSSNIQHIYEEPETFAEKTDIVLSSSTDENDASVGAGFDIVLVDN